MIELSLFADDTLTGGGIVGGIVTITGALYVIYDKYKQGAANRAAKKDISDAAIRAKQVVTDAAEIRNNEEELRVWNLARKAVSEAYQNAISQTKENHDRDMRSMRAQITAMNKRVTQFEERELQSQHEMDTLRKKNDGQGLELTKLRTQNEVQEIELLRLRKESTNRENEITELRAEIDKLRKQLQASGAIDGSDTGTKKALGS